MRPSRKKDCATYDFHKAAGRMYGAVARHTLAREDLERVDKQRSEARHKLRRVNNRVRQLTRALAEARRQQRATRLELGRTQELRDTFESKASDARAQRACGERPGYCEASTAVVDIWRKCRPEQPPNVNELYEDVLEFCSPRVLDGDPAAPAAMASMSEWPKGPRQWLLEQDGNNEPPNVKELSEEVLEFGSPRVLDGNPAAPAAMAPMSEWPKGPRQWLLDQDGNNYDNYHSNSQKKSRRKRKNRHRRGAREKLLDAVPQYLTDPEPEVKQEDADDVDTRVAVRPAIQMSWVVNKINAITSGQQNSQTEASKTPRTTTTPSAMPRKRGMPSRFSAHTTCLSGRIDQYFQ
ncbi:hypothetical protein C8035_v004767 [Colletotrichum spinosum]|uniref:Uncharacterized protein n=1 Tax=Colletotrichum spinosum TaxID=1347390 RepID=A0A4R8QV41_9PEZI|nr:hypothetical protein C8035_v004767 [Colletotrichum spinosum]